MLPNYYPHATRTLPTCHPAGKLREEEVSRDGPLAFFMGTIRHKAGPEYSKGVRVAMAEAFNASGEAGGGGVVFEEHSAGCDRDCYMRHLRRSTFCLCPRGWTPWTLRVYQVSPQDTWRTRSPSCMHLFSFRFPSLFSAADS